MASQSSIQAAAETATQTGIAAAVPSPADPIPPAVAGGMPLRPATLLLSLAAIAFAAAVFAALGAALLLLAELTRDGPEAFAEFMLQARFDPVLRARLGALAISLLYAGLAVATLAAARLAGGREWRHRLAMAAVRLRWRRVLGICLVTLAYAAALTLALARLSGRHAASDGPTDVLLLATLVGNLVVLAPLAEELFFRGWLFTALRGRMGFAPSFVLTTAAFAAIHWDANHHRVMLVMPLAVALGILREASGSIKPTMALHGAYNALIVAITLSMA